MDSRVLDTGATDHICGCLSWLTKQKAIKPIGVKLPNGNIATVIFSGTLQLTEFIFLKDVLYIPKFSFTLVSVTKLASQVHGKLIFNGDTCMIQYQSLRQGFLAANLLLHLVIRV